MPVELLGKPYSELQTWLDGVGVGRTHANRLFRGMHKSRCSTGEIRDLGRHAHTIERDGFRARAEVTASHPSADRTTRLVFALADGRQVEGVILPSRRPGRITLCLSSQVGCAMGCTFCATGTMGLSRHLSAGEIVAQVHAARAFAGRITHLVFMGMGEPLHNAAAVFDAIDVLTDTHGEPFQYGRITVSTVGRTKEITQLAARFGSRIQLAISLHAGTDQTRQQIVPLARSVSLASLKLAVVAYRPKALMVEYVFLPGVNDGEAEQDGVAAWVEGLPAMVNVIPFNPFGTAPFRTPTDEEVMAFCVGLKQRGVLTTIRWPRGREDNSACGQLMLAGATTP